MIGAVKDDVESLKAFGEELLAFFKKKEQDHISSFSFVVLQTLDGLLALHPSVDRRSIFRTATSGSLTAMYSPDLEAHYTAEIREYFWSGDYINYMDTKVPLFKERASR